jgi:hypothetical protein
VKKPVNRSSVRRDARRIAPASTILFLAANPLRVPTLQLNEECRAIERMLAMARFRDQVRFRACWAVRLDDLVQALNDDMPTILHFSGHGYGMRGICLQSEDGSASILSTDELVEIMQAAGDGVTAVVLNACYTEPQARALVKHVPCVVGTSEAIGDSAAIAYSRSLYRALASGRSVANAHRQGAAAFKRARTENRPSRDVDAAESASPADLTKLITRPDVDPNRICIAGQEFPLDLAVRRNHDGQQPFDP